MKRNKQLNRLTMRSSSLLILLLLIVSIDNINSHDVIISPKKGDNTWHYKQG